MNHTLRPKPRSRSGLVRAGFFLALPALGGVAFAQTNPPAASSGDVTTLSPFSVSTEKDSGYRASNSISGTRTNTPIKDIPVNIQVFTKDFSDDLLITNQVDLEAYSASLVNGGADHHSDNVIQQAYNAFLFRGFVQNWGLRDGIREYDPIDTQGLARVEVVKGPVGALYGLSYPGGIMNNISKDVDFRKNFTSIRLTGQSEGEYRAALDANYSGVAAGGKVGVRFNAVNSKTQDEREHSKGAIRFTQVNVNWQPTPTTELKFMQELGYREKPNGLSYFSRGETDAAGVSRGNSADIPLQITHPEIPWEWNWSNGRNMRSLETKLYRGSINQKIGEQVNVTAYVQFSDRLQIDGNGWDANGSGGGDSWEAGGGWIIDPVTKKETIQSGYSYRDWGNSMHSYGATAVYKVEFAQVKNTFAFGANVWSEKFLSRSSLPTTQNYLIYDVKAGIPIGTPQTPPTNLSPVTTGNGYTHESNSNDYYFANWTMSAIENRLKLNLGINRTNLKLVQWANGQAPTPNTTTQSKDSPLIGVMFDITKEISVFAVRATSLFPTTDKNSFGVQMPPVVGKSYEAGVKVELMNGKISGTVSYYQITQSGGDQNNPTANNLNTQRFDAMTQAQRDITFPGKLRSDLLGDLVPGGEAESKGFETDLIFQPTREWQILFSYAHNDQKTTKALAASNVGITNSGHITNQYSILTKYSFTEGEAKGAFVGLGLVSAGKALQDYQGAVKRYNPSTFNAEVFGGYHYKLLGYNTVVQLNVKNLTKQNDFAGWRATGSTALATQRYTVPTAIRYALTVGLDF